MMLSITAYNVQNGDIYNMDENGFAMGKTDSAKVILARSDRNHYSNVPGNKVSVALSLGVLTIRDSRLQGTKCDGRLKTTTSWVRHRLHAWEENRKRRGVARICIWAAPLGWQH
jgi:hypothetical protein